MQIEVRDKSFDITFVNNWCREQYQELQELIDEITDISAKVDKISSAIKTAEGEESKKLLDDMREHRKRMKEISTEIVGKPKKINRPKQYGIRELIVKEIIETNDYDYDEHWWNHNTDVEDVNDFMLTCMQKDLKKSGSKKK